MKINIKTNAMETKGKIETFKKLKEALNEAQSLALDLVLLYDEESAEYNRLMSILSCLSSLQENEVRRLEADTKK